MMRTKETILKILIADPDFYKELKVAAILLSCEGRRNQNAREREEEKRESERFVTSDISSDADRLGHEHMVHEFAESINSQVADKQDRSRVQNRCGTCLVFHTPFCLWEYKDLKDRQAERALWVDAEAYACSAYYPLKLRVSVYEKKKAFEKRVAALE